MGGQALPGKRRQAFLLDLDDVVLVTDPRHPLYDARVHLPPDEAIVKNMMVYGVKVAVKVRKNGEAVEVVDGRRRVVNAREASRRLVESGGEALKVPCEVERGSDAEMAAMMVFVNELRRQDDPIEKATKMQRFLDHGRTEDEVGDVFGIGRAQVRNYLSLLDLAPRVQAAVSDGALTMTGALKDYGKVPREEQEKRLEKDPPKKPTGGKKKKRREQGLRAPNKKKVRAVAAVLGGKSHRMAREALKWAIGDLPAEELPPRLRKAVEEV